MSILESSDLLISGPFRMASAASSQSQPTAQSSSAQGHEGMVVDLEAREKRKAEIPVPSDSDDENLHATPAENPNPTAAMSVEDLVRYSIQQNEKHFNKLDKDMSKLQREGSETRKMAARAVTTAEDTRQKVDKLERRLNALEAKASRSPRPDPSPKPSFHRATTKVRMARTGR